MERFTNMEEIIFTPAEPGQIPSFSIASLGADNPKRLREKLRYAAEYTFWWLSPYWISKGAPKEHFQFKIDDHNLDVINYSDNPFNVERQREFITFLNIARQFEPRGLFPLHQYFLIDNEDDPEKLPTGGATSGQNHMNIGYIQLHPPIFLPEFREIPGVPRFLGTLIHEYTHSFITHNLLPSYSPSEHALRQMWQERFGWMHAGQNTTAPERCISSYAQVILDEDVCESVVGAIFRPDLLDSEKDDVLRQTILRTLDKNVIEIGKVSRTVEPPSGLNPVIYSIRTGIQTVTH